MASQKPGNTSDDPEQPAPPADQSMEEAQKVAAEEREQEGGYQ